MQAFRTMAKSVCIVGAGPSGIVTAKTLLYNFPKDSFKVVIFEQSERIGGLWPLSTTDGGMVNPDMCTNLSRHTVSFSDMAWHESSSMFPKAWEVGQYLKRYTQKYSGMDIQTSCKVLKAFRSSETLTFDNKRWTVQVQRRPSLHLHENSVGSPETDAMKSAKFDKMKTETLNGQPEASLETHSFDYVVVASGFFGKPKLPKDILDSADCGIPVQHSTQFRDIKSLLKADQSAPQDKGTKILVVGGSMSGAEVAASIALQLSSAVHGPGPSQVNDASKYTVHHLVKRPFWVMPLFLPVNPLATYSEDHTKIFDSAPKILPLDLVMYNLTTRAPGPLKNNSGHIAPQAALKTNDFLRSFIGSDQNDLKDQTRNDLDGTLAMRGGILKEAPWLTISDTYSEFVRSGNINVSAGRLSGFSPKGPLHGTSVVVSSDTQDQEIDDIAAIVLATGFEASDSLGFLANDLVEHLGYDANCSPFPVTLDLHSTVHHHIPDLGFVGFYRGPFWGVMEMQARFLGQLWTSEKRAAEALASHVSNVPELRKLFYDNPQELAQFPMGDYVYLMENFKEIMDIKSAGEARKGPVLPARYTLPDQSSEMHQESAKALSIVQKVYDDSHQNRKFVARAIFRSLQGDWKLNRSLISSISTYPSGTFSGTAKFFPRYHVPEYDGEYLYLEEGDFETEQGMKFRANRRYAHRYHESADKLSVWFVKSDNKTVDYLFHELEILPPEGKSGWRAQAHHLCIDDTYDVKYEFRFRGAGIEQWSLAYSVKGPSKDYRIESLYRR